MKHHELFLESFRFLLTCRSGENSLTNMTFFSPLLLKRGTHLSAGRNCSVNMLLLVGVVSPLLLSYSLFQQGKELNKTSQFVYKKRSFQTSNNQRRKSSFTTGLNLLRIKETDSRFVLITNLHITNQAGFKYRFLKKLLNVCSSGWKSL